MSKNYYGSMCITAKLNFSVNNTDKTIEEVKQELLSLGFRITILDENYEEIPKEKIEIVEMEGQIIEESQQGNIKEHYTDDFEIYEEEE